MRLNRYILLTALMLIGVTARGQSDFNPANPPEPNATYRLNVVADPAEGGSVTGGGNYRPGTKVTVKATIADVEWQFVNWTNSAGDEVSASASYAYTMGENNETLTAHFQQVATSELTLQSNCSLFNASTTRYKVGAKVNVSCNTYSYYTFRNWTDKDGNVVSESRSFTYTVTEENQVLTANHSFTPGSPAEPSETKPKHKVYFTVSPSDAGTFSQTSGMQVTEGNNFSVTAYNATSYAFVNWTDEAGNVVGNTATYTGRMGTEDIRLTANFRFSPGNPADPGTSSAAHYTLYMPTVQMFKGLQALLPVYLENTGNVKELTFSLVLPENVNAVTDDIRTTSRTFAYSPVATQSGQTLTVSVAGGSQIGEHNGVLVLIPVTATAECEDGAYDVVFAEGTATLTDETAKPLTFRRGTLEITTLEEGDLQAQFNVDRYMNRALFTNMSSGDISTYTWDFGDGTVSHEENPMHIYDNPGTYTVRLTVKAIIKESVAEQNIIINAPNTWVAAGDYTIDPDGYGVRNFNSLHEMMTLLSPCTFEGNIAVTVADGDYAENINDDMELYNAFSSKLGAGNLKLRFASETAATIALTFDDSYLGSIAEWLKQVETDNVSILINGVRVNTSAMTPVTEQTVRSGQSTAAVCLTGMSDDRRMTVAWTANVKSGSHLSGYEERGTGDIPSMVITNGGSSTECVTYTVEYSIDGSLFYTLLYNIYVQPVMNADDHAALKVLYNATNGATWTKGWQIDSDIISSAAYPGVTFDADGRVTAISLSNNNMRGNVPAEGFVLPALATLNLSGNALAGDLVAFVAELPALSKLNMSNCLFEELGGVLPATITSLDLSSQCSSRALNTFTLQEWAMGSMMENVALGSLISYNHAAQDFSAHPRLRVVNTANSSTVAYLTYSNEYGSYGVSSFYGGHYNLPSGTEFLVQPTEGTAQNCKLRASLTWESGDANADGNIDIFDVQSTINYVFETLSSSALFNFVAADTKTDSRINVLDVVKTVDIILAQDNGAAGAPSIHRSPVSQQLAYVDNGILYISSCEDVAAFDITLAGTTISSSQPGLSQLGFSFKISGSRIVAYSLSGATIPAGVTALMTVDEGATVQSVLLSNSDAKPITMSADYPTNIIVVEDNAGGGNACYNTAGQKVSRGYKGIVIQNGKKVVVK